MPDKPDVPGILVRGADGSLYFIPEDHLKTFRVNPGDNKEAQKQLKAAQKLLNAAKQVAKHGRAPAFYGKGLVEKLESYSGSICTVAIECKKLKSIVKPKRRYKR